MSSPGQAPELESLRLQVADLARELAARDQSMQIQQQSLEHAVEDLRAQSDLLQAIMEGTAADTGDEFFASLATHLTASLHMQYVVIGEIVDGGSATIRTLAVASGGALLNNFEYELAQAPCRTALTESFWCYDAGVQALFPHFPPLATLGVESHSGVSIRNKQGDAVGLIVVMDTKPMTNRARLQALLHVFAPRVAAELQRKHIETALHEQTQRLAHAQALAHLGSWDWEIGSGRMEWSDEQFRIFGHEPGVAVTTHEAFLAAVLPDDHGRVSAAMNATLVGQAPFDLECRLVGPTGDVRVIHARGEVHRDATGQPIRMNGTVLDITERKQAEEAVRQIADRLSLATRAGGVGVWDWDLVRNVLTWDDQMFALYGVTRDCFSGTYEAWKAGVLPEDVQQADAEVQMALRGEKEFDAEFRVRWPNGTIRNIRALTTVQRDASGRPLRMIGMNWDITDRKRMEEALRQREQDLRAAIEERERISQDLHDGIFQSLFAVGLGLEASKSAGSLRNRKAADLSLDRAIHQLNRVIREIRSFIEGLNSDPLQGRDLPTALRHMVTSLTQNQLVRVHLAVEERAARAVSAEQSLHLFHVIQEAMSNCIRHGRAQEATVSLKLLKQGVRLSIRDNGSGFNPDAVKGTGHGLINMAARAQKIGGRFTVSSKVNAGTRVVFDLPKDASYVRH